MIRRGFVALLAAFALAAPAVPASAATGTTVTPVVVTGSGFGFDACTAPPVAVLRAWSVSPYKAVNLYFGGSQRACPNQPELTADWVTTALTNAWALLPTYVDLQAPCYGGGKQTMNPATASTDGANAAATAIGQLQALGLDHTIAYLDLEPFDPPAGDTTCASTVLAFTDAWTQTLHGSGFRSGVYVNANHGASVFVDAYAGDANRPDDIWVARYDGNAVADDAVLNGTWPHHRIHQYAGGHNETYGNEALSIDSDAIDGDVVAGTSVVTPAGPPYAYAASVPSGTTLKHRVQPTTAAGYSATSNNGDPLAVQCQATGESVDGDLVWDRLTDGTYASDLYTTTTGRNGLSPAIARCDTTPPTIAVKTLPSAVTASSVTVSWSARDGADPDGNPNGEARGISSSTVRYRVARWDGSFGSWHTTSTTAFSYRIGLSAGYDYCVQVTATDLSANSSPWSPLQCVVRPLDDRSLSASRGWSRKSGSHYYLHTYTSTSGSGRTLSRTKARVARIGIVATTCSSCGTVRLYVGKHYVGTISLRSAKTHYQQVRLLKPFSLRTATVIVKTTSWQLVQVDGLVISRT